MTSKYNVLYKTGGGDDIMKDLNDTLTHFFQHQIQIKMLHFTTKNHDHHKIFDDYLAKFSSKFDKLMEVGQGYIKNRVSLQKLEVDITNDENKIIDDMLTYTNTLMAKFSNTPLTNIIDDMRVDILQMKYLLTFE